MQIVIETEDMKLMTLLFISISPKKEKASVLLNWFVMLDPSNIH